MAFESVNEIYLKNAINDCNDSLNYKKTEALISKVSNSITWKDENQIVLQKAIQKLIDVRFEELKDALKQIELFSKYIEQYKKVEKNIDRLETENKSLNKDLYYEKKYEVESVDSNGQVTSETKTKMVENKSVAQEINDNKDKILELNNDLKMYEKLAIDLVN